MLLDTLNSERFVDTAPAAVHATLLEEGQYLGSVRTMYRLLAANGGCRERRNQLTHPAYTKPELLAVAPNQVWSWDITKLKGPAKWTCFHLLLEAAHHKKLVVAVLNCLRMTRGPVAQAGFRDRYGALPELRWAAQDHRGHSRIGGDRADPHTPRPAGPGAAADPGA